MFQRIPYIKQYIDFKSLKNLQRYTYLERVKPNFPIYKICITGGPCSGKTTSQAMINDVFNNKGFHVYNVPELATLTILGGGQINKFHEFYTKKQMIQFYSAFIKQMMSLEDYFYEMALINQKKALIVNDRGLLDPKGYMDQDMWQEILDQNNWNEVDLRDRRYDAIIHLVSAAKGAEKYYTLANNKARSESLEVAKDIDNKIIKAWMGHQYQEIIENNNMGFTHKINRVINAMNRYLGMPTSLRKMKQFLAEEIQFPQDLQFEQFQVKETFLKSSKNFEIVRRRGNKFQNSYTHIKDTIGENNQLIRTRKNIDAKEYTELIDKADENYKVMQYTSTAFILDQNQYIVQQFNDEKITLLKVILKQQGDIQEDQDTKIKLPDFIKIKQKISDESFSRHLAQKKIQ